MLLLNELTLHRRKYPQQEINRKFALVLPGYLANKTKSIRERNDFNTMSLEKLFGN